MRPYALMKSSTVPLLTALLLFCHGASSALDEKPDGSARLRFEYGQAIVVRDGTALASAIITIDAPVQNHPGVGNSAFLIVANCFAVVREVHDLTPTCHAPPTTLVELTRLTGDDRRVSRFLWPRSFFQGTSLSSPRGDWGLILSGNRAMIDGYLVLGSDGSHVSATIDPPLDWRQSYGRVEFEEEMAVFPSLKRGDTTVSLLIHRAGNSEVVATAAEGRAPGDADD